MDNKEIVREALEAGLGLDLKNSNPFPKMKQALTALDNLYDKAALIVTLEGMKINTDGRPDFKEAVQHNAAIDAVLKELK